MKNKKIGHTFTLPLFIFLNFIFSFQAYATAEFEEFFAKGSYQKAIEELKKAKNVTSGESNYLAGLCYSRLQEFDRAILEFEKAIQANYTKKDLYYELGQAQYADNNLRKSRESFLKSIKQNFNLQASRYYVAHISQILEDFAQALDEYQKIISDKSTDEKILQISSFQYAETLLSLKRMEKNLNNDLASYINQTIIPKLKEAKDIDNLSNVSNDIKKRISELTQEFDLDPNVLKNGRKINPKQISGYILQRAKFDDNVSLTNEENNVQQSMRESFIFETEFLAKHERVFNRSIIVSPEMRLTFIQNSDQTNPEVYQNDSAIIALNLKNKYEHRLFLKPASFLFDLEYLNTLKDWKQTHTRQAYASSLTFTLGERFSYFNFGDTTIRLKNKQYKGQNESISNNTITITADQTVALISQNLLIFLLEADLVDNYNNKQTSTNSYLARVDYLINDIYPQYTLGLALATTLTDTLEQSATRGSELSLNPSIDLSKEITDKLNLSLNIDYTQNNSKQVDYKYKKTVVYLELKYNF